MRPVVSNTSPLINLAGVGHLDLLQQLYTKIWIPELVLAEYMAKAIASDPNLGNLPWLQVRASAPNPTLQITTSLGAGEMAALSLAQASNAQLVILDDKRARRVADQLGITVTGTLGVLLAAKQVGLLASLQPVLDRLIAQGRRITAQRFIVRPCVRPTKIR